MTRGGETAVAGAVLFCGLPAAPDPFVKNAWTLPGPGHGAYLDFRRNMSAYDIRTYGKQVPGSIDPAMVEDVLLDTASVARPELFWSQHMPLGTSATFEAVARRVPDVRAALDAGADLADLERDPWLGSCTRIYFNTGRPDALLVLKGPGFYWLQSNGRHRAIAARLAGLGEIPAAVIGEITKK